jgi:hypothetical protein
VRSVFSPSTTSTLATAGVALGFIGAALGSLAQVRLAALRRSYSRLLGSASEADIATIVGQHVQATEHFRREVSGLRGEVALMRTDLGDAIRHVAVVRYDAFGDMGGRLSFSAALLDDAGDGLVLTSINGRSETRTYAKGVKAGESDHSLSPEELQAISYASRTGVQPSEAEESAPRRSRFSRR